MQMLELLQLKPLFRIGQLKDSVRIPLLYSFKSNFLMPAAYATSVFTTLIEKDTQ